MVLAIIALLIGCGGSSGGDNGIGAAPDPVIRAQAIAIADTWIADHPATTLPWDWGEGVLTFGLLELANVTGEGRFQDYVREYVRYHDSRGVTYFWNDHLTPALSAAILLLREGGTYPHAFDGALTYIFVDGPRTRSGGLRHLGFFPYHVDAELWVDSLFHFVPLLGRAYLLDPQPRFLDEAAAQVALFAEHMQDPATDLFTHAWSDEQDRQIPSFEAAVWWARGNGWAIAAMVDLLSILPTTHPQYQTILDRCLRLEAALRSAQAPGGRYHTVLLDRSTYLETAASGLITYAMARGVRQRLFGADTRAAARLGMSGLQEVLLIDVESGRIEVTGTSLGTSPIASLYRSIPTDKQISYGVGAWLLAATEFFREGQQKAAR